MSENQQANAETATRHQRLLVGRVVSDRMDKTIVVLIERRTRHPLYGKYIRRSTKLKAHDAENKCRVGDVVEISEGRPVSRHKAWTLNRVVEAAGEFGGEG